MEINLNKPYKGLHTDNNPSEQPKDSYRFALNAVNETDIGNQLNLSNEPSNISCTNIPEGFVIIGDKYIENNETVLFLCNQYTGYDQIGILKKDNKYTAIVDTQSLGFSVNNQIDCTYRLRRGNEKIVYWVDGNNKPRSFNITRPEKFYNKAYTNYINSGGNPNTYIFEKWDVNSFNLVKTYNSIPYFSKVEVLDYGNLLVGSYNFAIQYVDEDLNSTNWVNVSNTVNIFKDNKSNSYETIRGDFNLAELVQTYKANKTIKLEISDLDITYPFYRIAIIQATGGTGNVTKTLVSTNKSTGNNIFTYSGGDSEMAETSLESIIIDSESILAPKHIEQLENRLVLANTLGSNYNWCDFQKYASKVNTDFTTKPVILNDIKSTQNVKNENSTFFYRGYMPGEVYSFGIIYIMKDYSLSPVFHIPGKSKNNTTSLMDVYESSSIYEDIHSCNSNNYWGNDVLGDYLIGNKVRHHKFPTRNKVNKPLVSTTSTSINFKRYKLKLKITLKPSQTYPVDASNNPLIINYQANYKILSNPISNYNSVFSKALLGTYIEILDVTSDIPNYIIQQYPPNYLQLNPTCDIVANYSNVFQFDYYYEDPVIDSVNNADTSDIFGINFFNIEKPHTDVVGFYIVRNEVTDDDKLILDNCIVGPNVKYNDYVAFTHITPKFSSGATTKIHDKSAFIFSPEANYNRSLLNFNDLNVEGVYTTKDIKSPLNEFHATDEDGESTDDDPVYGVYIEDVQAGTSYDKSVHKKREKDTDGFSLQCGYKTSRFNYSSSDIELPKIENNFMLSATHDKIIDGTNYLNVSTDNRICMTTFDTALDTNIYNSGSFTFPKVRKNDPQTIQVQGTNLYYAAMRRGSYDGANWRDVDYCYQDFLTRPYYKEHMQPFMFGSNNIYSNGADGKVPIFNGDVEISSMNFITTMFRQLKVEKRATKTSWWKYVLGALIIIAGVVIGIATIGTGAAATAAAITAGVSIIAAGTSIGVSLLVAGVNLDKAIAMFEEHYSKGILECVEDDCVKAMLGTRDTNGNSDFTIGDDCIQWFSDRAANLYIESRIPFGLRSGTVENFPDFLDAPGQYNDSTFYNYLREKLTSFDRDNNGGRLYRGLPTAEVYVCNPDYSRFNKQKSYIHLPENYDCCSQEDNTQRFPMRVWYSQQSFQEELTDNYASFLPNNYRDIEGENGEITDLHKIGNSLFIHTKEALWQLPQNNQERISGELISFIGTGDFFSIPPRKILDDNLGSGGTQHKWSKLKTKFGTIFVNEIENKVYLQSEGLKDISAEGNRNWFEQNLKPNLSQQIYNLTGQDYIYNNNPANTIGVGYISCYDTRFERFLLTKKDYSIIDLETLHVDEVIYGESPNPICTVIGRPVLGYSAKTQEFWIGNTYSCYGSTSLIFTHIIKDFSLYPEFFENKSWTLSYSFLTNTWISFHSYLPNYYIHNQNDFFSFINSKNDIWKHNVVGNYQTYYGKYNPHIIEYVSNSNPLVTRITDSLMFIANARKYDTTTKEYFDVEDITHNKIHVYNSKQSSGELTMLNKGIQNDGYNYLFNQIKNVPGQILIDRNERTWSINQLRDFTIDYQKSIFTKDWSALQNNYYIDKVPNNVTSFNKNWSELQSFRDKYLVVRLKFDIFADVNISTQYSLESEDKSER